MQSRRRRCGFPASIMVLATMAPWLAMAQIPPTSEVPSENTDVPVSTAETEPPTAKLVCTDEASGDAIIDKIRSRLYKLTCSSASWFDGLFGNSRYDEEYRSTYGSLTTGALWSERKSWQEIVRFRAKLALPQMNKRLHAFIGRVDRDDYISEAEPQVYGLPDDFNRNSSEQTLLGIGYNEPLKKRGSFDTSTGVRITFPLDPYVKGSYRYARPIGERNLIRLRETLFWQHSEEFGVTSRVDWDRVIGEQNLMRYTASGTYSQVSEGLRWFANVTLFHFVSTHRAFAYEAFLNGSTDHVIPLTDYGAFVVYRQLIWRDWLLLELRGGVDWPRDLPIERRRSNLNGGLAFELRFGRSSDRDAVTPTPPSPLH